MHQRQQLNRRIPFVLASILAAALALSACGSGSVTGSTAAGSPATPTAGQTVPRQPIPTRTVAARVTSNRTAEHATAGPARAVNPCSYVTAAQAAAAFHTGSVARTVGQLGPTCIFTTRTTHRQLGTMAVGTNDIRTQAKIMRNAAQKTIDGHRGVCGKLGSSLLLVDLGGGRTLSIQAPCPQASALAHSALPRIER